jgi:hypothetical protein
VGEGTLIAPDMWVRVLPIADLREQDINANVMAPAVFERLVENVKRRGALESVPYCARPNDEGPTEIVSGHHRVRAAHAAGLKEVPVMVDTAEVTRSTVIAKQLAHNALDGDDDPDIVKQLVGFIDTPDDLLVTGLPPELLDLEDRDAIQLFTPRVDFGWKNVTFAALPHQLEQAKELVDQLDGRQDLVILTLPDQFDAFLAAAAKFARIKDIRSGGTAVALLIDTALAEIKAAEKETSSGEAKPKRRRTKAKNT